MNTKRMTAAVLGLLTTLVAANFGFAADAAAKPKHPDKTQAAAPLSAAPAVGADGAHELTAADVNAWLDGYMPYALQTGDIAGAVVAVVKDGQVLTERGYGYADVEARKPVDPKLTLFRPGSVSKLFTWTAVMQLVEQGKIDLDADVNQYLDFKIPPARASRSRCATSCSTPRASKSRPRASSDDPSRPELRQAAEAVGSGARVRAGHHARVLQLRRIARRLHRAAQSRAVIRRLHRQAHLRAAGHEAFDLPPAAAGRAGAAHVQGLPAGVRDSRSSSRSSGRLPPVRCPRPPRTWRIS